MAVENRNQMTSFALKDSEKRLLQEACRKLGLRMSEYIRLAVMRQVKKDEEVKNDCFR